MRRSRTGLFGWTAMAMQGTMLALEAQQVIALRLAKFAAGEPDAHVEAQRMVTEKVHAAMDSGQMFYKAALGGHGDMGADKILKRYRTAVRANRRRLSK